MNRTGYLFLNRNFESSSSSNRSVAVPGLGDSAVILSRIAAGRVDDATAADAFKYYGLQPGVQGTLGLCKGGTN